ncbi:MAG: hypothetical protein AAF959_14935 [Cyanobacteria bacterium P01_D01_bin.56]
MLTSEGLTELKYQEVLEYQDMMATMYSVVTEVGTAQVGCLITAVLTSLVMGGCARVFMPKSRHNNQR